MFISGGTVISQRIISEVGVSAEIRKGKLLNTDNEYNNFLSETTPLHFGFET
jgi:hypothetical protein